MAKLGSVKYQVSQVISKINGIGQSKLESRTVSGIKSLESGHSVSDKIHSYKSLKNIKNDLTNLSNYAKSEHQIKDISKINIEVVKDWIDSKNITYNTASNYMSELNKVSEHFSYSREEIKELRADLKQGLERNQLETRAYQNLDKITLREHHQPAFELQRDYGLRVSAATRIDIDKQLSPNNMLTYREKGGKISEKQLTPNLASKLREQAKEGKYEANQKAYSRELARELNKTGQEFNGTHGIRHSYAQKQLETHTKAEVSKSMGHTREEITDTYLR
jgi:integrase